MNLLEVSSREEFNLFNPAFIAEVQAEVVRGYRSNLELALVFSASTMAVYPHLRDSLPSSTRTRLAKWVTDHPEFRPEFTRLLPGLVPALRRGALFGSQRRLFIVDGSRLGQASRRRPRPSELTDETSAALDAASFLGRWFAGSGTPATVLSLLGFGQ